MSLTELRALAGYWTREFDWFETERLCNSYPQYRADVGDQPIHFLHIKGLAPRALVLTHGWPGSVFEFLASLIGSPFRIGSVAARKGGDVIIPALPGYGFSTPLRQPIGPAATADLFHRLVTEVLGYGRYIAQGGDWGSAVSSWMTYRYPEHCGAFTRITVPTPVAAFPDPVFLPPPRSLVEKSYDVRRWTEMPWGGHFAAMEEPLLFVDDVRAFASSL